MQNQNYIILYIIKFMCSLKLRYNKRIYYFESFEADVKICNTPNWC